MSHSLRSIKLGSFQKMTFGFTRNTYSDLLRLTSCVLITDKVSNIHLKSCHHRISKSLLFKAFLLKYLLIKMVSDYEQQGDLAVRVSSIYQTTRSNKMNP